MRTTCAHNMANKSKLNFLPYLVPYSIFGWFHRREETDGIICIVTQQQ